MLDTTFFVQCENCKHFTKCEFGYVCDMLSIYIDNPERDGCTWGDPKEVDNA